MDIRKQSMLRETEEKQVVSEVKNKKVYQQVTKPVFTTDAGFLTLTIDDGPSPYTDELLDILERKSARAIFFMIGENVEKHRQIVRKVFEAGHVIGNHSYSHPFFTKISAEKALEEINKTSNLIADITGVAPPYFRPPYGAFNESTLLLSFQNDMKVVMWSADPKDYSLNTESAVLRATEPLLASRKILLLHDLKDATVEALPTIIDDVRNKQLQITTQYEH